MNTRISQMSMLPLITSMTKNRSHQFCVSELFDNMLDHTRTAQHSYYLQLRMEVAAPTIPPPLPEGGGRGGGRGRGQECLLSGVQVIQASFIFGSRRGH